MNKIEYGNLIAFHPGYYVKDFLEGQSISQEEFAKRLQTSPKYVSDLVNGRINLSEEMILKLSTFFGISCSSWRNLNNSYLEVKSEIERQKRIDAECDLVRQLDYSFWVNLHLVKNTRSAQEKVIELQKYFKVSSLNVLCEKDFLVQFRTGITKVKDINIMNSNAWIQTAINIGHDKEVKLFDSQKLKKEIPEIRSMILQEPEVFVPKLTSLLSECGVVFVLLPNLKNCGVNGAVKWFHKDKVLLAMNERRKYSDTFWFSFFHELGHVLQQRLKLILISDEQMELLKTNELIERLEKEADAFAKNTLIPEKEYEAFLQLKKFDTVHINAFASSLGIQSGIVVGRLQMDGYLGYQSLLNKLKIKYEFHF